MNSARGLYLSLGGRGEQCRAHLLVGVPQGVPTRAAAGVRRSLRPRERGCGGRSTAGAPMLASRLLKPLARRPFARPANGFPRRPRVVWVTTLVLVLTSLASA